MTKLDLFWMSNKDWIKFERLKYVLRDDAPEEARESYERYLKQVRDAAKRDSI